MHNGFLIACKEEFSLPREVTETLKKKRNITEFCTISTRALSNIFVFPAVLQVATPPAADVYTARGAVKAT